MSKVGETIELPVGTSLFSLLNNIDDLVEKDRTNSLVNLTKIKYIGDLSGTLQISKSKPRNIKKKHKRVGLNLAKENNNLEGLTMGNTLPTSVPPVVIHGEILADSDILRCIHRILSNFDLSGDDKLQRFITKLGVVYGDLKRDVEKKIEYLKRMVIERIEGWSELIEQFQ